MMNAINYTAAINTYNNKVKNYSMAQCTHALNDCHDTLKIGRYDVKDNYAIKLWIEIDAIRGRIMKINPRCAGR